VLNDGSNAQIVDFSSVLGGGDGIMDGAVSYSGVAEISQRLIIVIFRNGLLGKAILLAMIGVVIR